MFCKNCGFKIEDEDIFCTKCGFNLKNDNQNKRMSNNIIKNEQKTITVNGDQVLKDFSKTEDTENAAERWDNKMGMVGSSLTYTLPKNLKEELISAGFDEVRADLFIAQKCVQLENVLSFMLLLLKTCVLKPEIDGTVVLKGVIEIIKELNSKED